MLDVLAGTNKPFIGTNGTLQVAGLGRLAVETDRAPAGPGLHGRAANEHLVIDAAPRRRRQRLHPDDHPDRAHQGRRRYLGDGHNVWPAVHRDDAARLYRLALEHVPAGTALHAAAEQGVAWRDIAETIAQGTGLPTKSLAPAGAHFGWMAGVVGAHNPSSSEATRKLLRWQPTEPGLLADMREHYFR